MATATAVPPTSIASPDSKEGKKKPKKFSRKKLIIGLIVLALIAGAAYMFVLKPKAPEGPPALGPVLKLESITLNLEGTHLLKLGFALQFTADSAGGHGAPAPDGSQALDLAIEQFSNKKIIELNSSAARKAAKAELIKEIEKAYHGAVVDVYFTEFVMQ